MSDRLIPTLFLSLSALAIAPFVVPAIAYQQFFSNRIDATIQFSANSPPAVGKISTAHFLLSDKNNQPVPLSNCHCQVRVQDFRDRTIFSNLPLSAATIDGKAAIATEIVFSISGSHTVILSGQIQSSEPFEIRFPVTAVHTNPTY